MEKITLPAWTEELKRGSQWVLGNMQLNIPLSSIAALNEMWTAAAVLRDRSDVFRHSLKQRVNQAIRVGDHQKTLLMHYMQDVDVMDVFTDHIVDVTAGDVTALRDCIREKLAANGVKEAVLAAWVETARMLLILAVQHFNMVMIHARQKFGHDWTKYFRALRMDAAKEAWDLVAGAIDTREDLMAEDDVLERHLLYLCDFIHSDQLHFWSFDLFRPAWSYFIIFRVF